MKDLIVETTYQQIQIKEDKSDTGLTKISGIAGSVDQLNGNKRVYPRNIIEGQLPLVLKEANNSNRIGAVDHPAMSPRIADLGIKFTDLRVEGSDIVFEAVIIPTDAGRNLEALIRAGVAVGISSRGYGSVKKGEWNGEPASIVQDDFELVTYDAVVEPSVADARIASFERLQQIERLMNMDEQKLQAIVDAVTADETLAEDAEPAQEAAQEENKEQETPQQESETQAIEEEYYTEESDIINEAKWTKAFVDTLPDSSFAYVEPGEKKDGKTEPLSKRHLPYKDKDGKPDAAHVRNALARLDQTDGIPAGEKDAVRKKLLAAAKELGIETSEKESVETETPVLETELATESNESEVNPLQEQVTALEAKVAELTEAQAVAEAKAQALKESAQSLAALLVALKTALAAELDDDDWSDADMLSSFGYAIKCRSSYEAYCDDDDMDDNQQHTTFPAIESFKDLLPTFIQKHRELKRVDAIATKTRHERFGRAIAEVLYEAAKSATEVDTIFEDVKTRVFQKLNAVQPVVTRGNLEAESRWTPEQIAQRRLIGLPV